MKEFFLLQFNATCSEGPAYYTIKEREDLKFGCSAGSISQLKGIDLLYTNRSNQNRENENVFRVKAQEF